MLTSGGWGGVSGPPGHFREWETKGWVLSIENKKKGEYPLSPEGREIIGGMFLSEGRGAPSKKEKKITVLLGGREKGTPLQEGGKRKRVGQESLHIGGTTKEDQTQNTSFCLRKKAARAAPGKED